MESVNGADFDTIGVLAVDALFGNNVCHGKELGVLNCWLLNAALVHVVIFKNLNLFFLNARPGLSVFTAIKSNWSFETFGNHIFLQMLPGNLVTLF